LKHLANLLLSRTAITDRGVEVLKQILTLQMLDLSGTAVTDECLVPLADMPSLATLGLAGTRISDRGIDKMKSWKKDQIYLFLKDTRTTVASQSALQAAHPRWAIKTSKVPQWTLDAEFVLVHRY
jgi:hypothetical protein